MKNKTNKNGLGIFLAMCLMVQMVLPGMVWESKAAGTETITYIISGSTYVANYADFSVHQLLTGTAPTYAFGEDGANPTAGDYSQALYNALDTVGYTPTGITIDEIKTALNELETSLSASASLNQQFALALESEVSSTTPKYEINFSDNFISGSTTSATTTLALDSISEGYYLIVDESDGSFALGYPPVLLIVDGNQADITAKGSLPTVEKKIYHNEIGDPELQTGEDAFDLDNDHTSGAWNNVGDNQMGDDVYFRVSATVPSSIDTYAQADEEYFLVLHDYMDSEQFDYNGDMTLTVQYAGGTTPDAVYTGATNITNVTGFTFTETNGTGAGAKDVWEYQLELSSATDAILGATLIFEYSAELLTTAEYGATPNENTVDMYYSDFSGTGSYWTGSITDTNNVEKAEKTVYDYTFSMDVTKIDNQSKSVEDAIFELTDEDGAKVNVTVDGSDDQLYYVDINSNSNEITTNFDGLFTIIGLDDTKTYTLTEKSTPNTHAIADKYITLSLETGYDSTGITLEDFTATVNSQVSVDDNIADVEVDDTTIAAGSGGTDPGADISEYVHVAVSTKGTVDATIVNLINDISLPSTGGVGTVMFYVVGAGVLLVAGYLLFVQKKNAEIMNNRK